MTYIFHLKYFLLFIIGFIIFTAVGTVTHELGHITVAELLGYDTTIYHDSMSYNYRDATELHRFFVTLGGPSQTILTGLLGLAILQLRRKKRILNGLKMLDWLAIFLALFWLREVFNVVMSIITEFLNPTGTFFSGDEAGLAWYLGLPAGTFAILFGTLGFLVGLYVVFQVIPKHIRLTFIAGGLVGGILGFIVWMNFLGPSLLP